MKRIVIIIVIIVLCSCKKDAERIDKHGEFNVEFLFEKDGCKMYRFYDGRTIYWANCEGRIQSDYVQRSGKTSTNHYEETITTK